MAASAITGSDVYTKNNKLPDVVRVEVELKKAVSSKALYIHINDQEILAHLSSDKLRYKNNTSNVTSDTTVAANTWYTITLDLDLANHKYDIYCDGASVATGVNLNTAITSPELIEVSANSSANCAYINYISVSALAPYGVEKDGLCKYYDENGNWYVGHAKYNAGDAAATHTLIAAKFDKNDNLVEISAVDTKTTAAGSYGISGTPLLSAENDEYYRYFSWEDINDTIKPLREALTIGKADKVVITYPGHVEKAITFSYDDKVSYDIRLMEIFNDAGIKATFNFITKRFNDLSQSKKDAIVEQYEGHEIANHSQNHPRMNISDDPTETPLTYEEIIAEIKGGQDDIKALTGSDPIGFVWPYSKPTKRDDLDEIMEYMKECGIKYVRPVTTTKGFEIPTDWYNWENTCHHNKMEEYLEKFIALESDGELDLMAVWGHSYELEDASKAADSTALDWDGMQKLANIIKADKTMWKATNGEIYNYIEATKLVKIDYHTGTITNNSDIDIYIIINGENKIVKKNSVFSMK